MAGSRTPRRLSIGCLAAAIGLLAGPAPVRAEAWHRYVNGRFGATVEYPERFSVELDPPANGDGQRFRTADGRAELAVFGFFNVLEETPRQMTASRRLSGTDYGYVDAKPNSFVLSGRRGDRITYERCLRSPRDRTIFACFNLEYPAEDRTTYDAIVSRISRSLTAEQPFRQ